MNTTLSATSATLAPAERWARHWPGLQQALEHCAARVPLYRGVDAAGGLAAFPVLTKARLRSAFPHQLVPEGERLPDAVKSGRVMFVGTSGTEGERVQVLWHQPWWDAQEVDGFAPHALAAMLVHQTGYKEAVLTTPVCSGNLCHVGKLPMADRIDGRTLFLNQTADPALWKDDDVRRMADELDAFAPAALEADPAYLAHFAVRLLRLGRRPHLPRFIDLSYSLPSRHHLATIAAGFPGVPLIDAYGSTECGFVFCACDRGAFHPNPGWTHAEALPLAERGLEGVARLLVTTLNNPWLNLVRFDTGDLVRPRTAGPCPCGRDDGLVLDSVEGRTSDLLVATDGRLVTPRAVDRALAGEGALVHWRLTQQGPAEFELQLVESGLAPLDPAAVAASIEPVLGARPRTRVVRSAPVEASGKLRLCKALHVDVATLVGAST